MDAFVESYTARLENEGDAEPTTVQFDASSDMRSNSRKFEASMSLDQDDSGITEFMHELNKRKLVKAGSAEYFPANVVARGDSKLML